MALAGTFNLVKIRLTIVTITTANLVRIYFKTVKSYKEKHFDKWTRFIRTVQLIIGILTGKSVNSSKIDLG